MTTGPAEHQVTVVYVAGKGRSGSTLLDDLLGSVPGVASLGEVRQLWDRADLPGYACACGRTVDDCELWGPSLAAVGAGTPAARAQVADLQRRAHRWANVPRHLAGGRSGAARSFGTLLGRLYTELAARADARVLIDSSKSPLHVGVLGAVPGITPRLLHLVRDPRAVAYSYTRRTGGVGQPELPRFGPVHSATSWLARNLTTEAAARRMPDGAALRLRYEDLAADPTATAERLGAWLGLPDPTAAFIDDRTLRLDEAHLVGGNPRRFDRGDITIRADERWRTEASDGAVRTVTGLTLPLLRRYGYPPDAATDA